LAPVPHLRQAACMWLGVCTARGGVLSRQTLVKQASNDFQSSVWRGEMTFSDNGSSFVTSRRLISHTCIHSSLAPAVRFPKSKLDL
jgi:hypothetical protein